MRTKEESLNIKNERPEAVWHRNLPPLERALFARISGPLLLGAALSYLFYGSMGLDAAIQSFALVVLFAVGSCAAYLMRIRGSPSAFCLEPGRIHVASRDGERMFNRSEIDEILFRSIRGRKNMGCIFLKKDEDKIQETVWLKLVNSKCRKAVMDWWALDLGSASSETNNTKTNNTQTNNTQTNNPRNKEK